MRKSEEQGRKSVLPKIYNDNNYKGDYNSNISDNSYQYDESDNESSKYDPSFKYEIWSPSIKDNSVENLIIDDYLQDMEYIRNKRVGAINAKTPISSSSSLPVANNQLRATKRSKSSNKIKKSATHQKITLQQLRKNKPKLFESNDEYYSFDSAEDKVDLKTLHPIRQLKSQEYSFDSDLDEVDENGMKILRPKKHHDRNRHKKPASNSDEYYSFDEKIDLYEPITHKKIRRRRSNIKRIPIKQNKPKPRRVYFVFDNKKKKIVKKVYPKDKIPSIYDEVNNNPQKQAQEDQNILPYGDDEYYSLDDSTKINPEQGKPIRKRRHHRLHFDNSYYSQSENDPIDPKTKKPKRRKRHHKLHGDNEFYSVSSDIEVDPETNKLIRRKRSHTLHRDNDYYSVDEETKRDEITGDYIRKKRKHKLHNDENYYSSDIQGRRKRRRHRLHGDNEYYSVDDETPRNPRTGKPIRQKRSHKLHGDSDYYSVDSETKVDNDGHFIRQKRKHKLSKKRKTAQFDSNEYSFDSDVDKFAVQKGKEFKREPKDHGDPDYYSIDSDTPIDPKTGKYIRVRRSNSPADSSSDEMHFSTKANKILEKGDKNYYSIDSETEKDPQTGFYIRKKRSHPILDHGDENYLSIDSQTPIDPQTKQYIRQKRQNPVKDHGDPDYLSINSETPVDKTTGQFIRQRRDENALEHGDKYFESIDSSTPIDSKTGKYIRQRRTHILIDHGDPNYLSIDSDTPIDNITGQFIRQKRQEPLKSHGDPEYLSITSETPTDPISGQFIRQKRKYKRTDNETQFDSTSNGRKRPRPLLDHGDENYYSVDSETPIDGRTGEYIRKLRNSKRTEQTEVFSRLPSPNKSKYITDFSIEPDEEKISHHMSKHNSPKHNKSRDVDSFIDDSYDFSRTMSKGVPLRDRYGFPLKNNKYNNSQPIKRYTRK
ncbi:hypothetical protein TVAG_373470 [Trichomonas vaginalis G3]|uniref:Uncharacterized protein n=1 Tax=Trichomonas vaginalis (strain ATCC PRA-98 / G3) TaxID=412133 RepID=A2DZL0_TRIV3|nr:hypothetical protein TVAGG3_0012250 [Trichomonas vaginalis G3]EAY14214.1 hypothetical protein TVAG_373470 [Trichomonas vaginalis G3]KAI5539212.1 hypothetical protein TVAGG3_0012250 [Trichomonas vaginalis G3]|eukprot:XP_001326437.1 hypothetical protein [Trichomonas vaginalis G3]